MEDNLQLFEHEEFGEVRVVMIDGEPWFVAADVCRILEIQNPTDMLKRLDEDDRARFNLGRSPVNGGGGEVNIVNEPGLYALIFASRKPEAKKFQRWVYHEVLPSIRKTGSYSVNKNTLANGVELLAKALLKYVDLECEKFKVENSEETKNFKKAQLLRELASAARDFYLRDSLVNYSAKLITGENFIEETHDHDEDCSSDLKVPPRRIK